MRRSITTQRDRPPIPNQDNDWSAWRTGTEESGPIGRGPSERTAIMDLLQIEEEHS